MPRPKLQRHIVDIDTSLSSDADSNRFAEITEFLIRYVVEKDVSIEDLTLVAVTLHNWKQFRDIIEYDRNQRLLKMVKALEARRCQSSTQRS